jgi:hypothetical protein
MLGWTRPPRIPSPLRNSGTSVMGVMIPVLCGQRAAEVEDPGTEAHGHGTVTGDAGGVRVSVSDHPLR